jgi:hypothetical protein
MAELDLLGVGETQDALIVDRMLSGLDSLAIVGVTDR